MQAPAARTRPTRIQSPHGQGLWLIAWKRRASQTRPRCALEIICKTAEPTTTKRKSAKTTGPTVKGAFSFLELLLTFPTPFSYCSALRDVLREAGIARSHLARKGRGARSTAASTE